MLRVENLSCLKGERVLFRQLSFCVDAGSWVHVRGENGAGKTSLLRMMAGLSEPDEGCIYWQNHPLKACRDAFHAELLYVGHLPALKDDLTALESLRFMAALEGRNLAHDLAIAALHQMGLRGREHLPVRVLSAGQKRRVSLSRLITRAAKLWVLDEPLTALDARAINVLTGLLATHLSQGGSAVMTSHQPVSAAAGQVVQL